MTSEALRFIRTLDLGWGAVQSRRSRRTWPSRHSAGGHRWPLRHGHGRETPAPEPSPARTAVPEKIDTIRCVGRQPASSIVSNRSVSIVEAGPWLGFRTSLATPWLRRARFPAPSPASGRSPVRRSPVRRSPTGRSPGSGQAAVSWPATNMSSSPLGTPARAAVRAPRGPYMSRRHVYLA